MSNEQFVTMWTLFVVVLILKLIQKLRFPPSIFQSMGKLRMGERKIQLKQLSENLTIDIANLNCFHLPRVLGNIFCRIPLKTEIQNPFEKREL